MMKPVRISRLLLASVALAALAGCSMLPSLPTLSIFGGADKPKPAELQPNPNLIGVRQAWNARMGAIDFPLQVAVVGSTIHVAGADAVAAIDAASGRELWRAPTGAPVAAGVGSDGNITAVVTRSNDVVAFSGGREVWRQRLTAQVYTPPFVAGGRVFVLAADRSITAMDGRTGYRLWTQARPGEPLVLRQAGVMLAVGDQLVVGQGGRLAGISPSNGAVRWEAPVASPRGINDVERLVDLVGRVSREGNVVCARAFQASVGCVDTTRGTVLWTQKANGSEGVHGDAANVFGSESDGRVVSWKRASGERAWSVDRLAHRGLTAPLALGRSVIVGDASGFVHMLSREDGSLLNRLATDGSAIVAPPAAAGGAMVVVTANGGIFGFVPQ